METAVVCHNDFRFAWCFKVVPVFRKILLSVYLCIANVEHVIYVGMHDYWIHNVLLSLAIAILY